MTRVALGLCGLTLLGCARSPYTWTPPAAPSATARQVRNAIEAGDGDLEVREWQRALVRDPRDRVSRAKLAWRFESVGAPELAIEHYRAILGERPSDEAARLGVVRNLRRLGMEKEAAAELEAAPDPSPAILSTLGIVRDGAGDYGAAETAHRAALRLAPGDAALHSNLGYNLFLQRRHAEAVECFEAALKIAPRSGIARGNLALTLAHMPGGAERALEHWKSMGGPAAAHNNLAAALIEQGRAAEAREQLALALREAGPSPETLANLDAVAKLDGGPAAVSPEKNPGAFSRAMHAMKRWLVHQDPAPAPTVAARGRSR
jgi:tetratricopeptide (TPR) repeat protein